MSRYRCVTLFMITLCILEFPDELVLQQFWRINTQYGAISLLTGHSITWCQDRSRIQPPLITPSQVLVNTTKQSNNYFRNNLKLRQHFITRAMPKHDKPILDVQAVQSNRDHYRHWETRFHDYCLLEGYRNPAKDRLTETADHYIAAKRPFELAVLRSAIIAFQDTNR